MKRLGLAFILSIFMASAFAQNVDLRRKIDVNGSAEMEITPDIIYIAVSLKEYMKDNKTKVSIATLEKQLQAAVLKSGIPQEDFMINNISSYTNYWNKKKDPNFLASKQYRIKLKDLNKLDQIIAAVDQKGIAYTNIESYTHSKIDEYKNQLKTEALKNAKNKAAALVQSVGSKLGDVLYIQDNNSDYTPQPVMYKTMAMRAESSADIAMPDIDFKKIKLNYTVNATFEIK